MAINFAQQASDSVRYVMIYTFSFLSALTLRDLLTRIWEMGFKYEQLKEKPNTTKYLLYQFLLVVVVLSLTIVISVFWENYKTFSMT